MSPMGSSWQEILAGHWLVLEARRPAAGMATNALSVTVQRGTVMAAVDRSGDHHLLVPLPAGTTVVEDSQSAHIRIQRDELVLDGVTYLFADVVCRRADLFELFDDVLAEILTRLETSSERPDLVCKHVLDEWRELLRRQGGILGDAVQRGLFGELVVLERILAAAPRHDLDFWTGPAREPHDFCLARGDLEVKALGAVGSEVEIHGVDQLEPVGGRSLWLILVRLTANRAGLTLPELVSRVASVVPDEKAFALQLARVGYNDEDAEYYRHRRFTAGGVSALPVSEGFPRIVRASFVDGFPDAISGLAYTLDVSALLPMALSDDSLVPLFETGDA